MFIQALTSRMLTNLARLKDHVHCILFRLKSYRISWKQRSHSSNWAFSVAPQFRFNYTRSHWTAKYPHRNIWFKRLQSWCVACELKRTESNQRKRCCSRHRPHHLYGHKNMKMRLWTEASISMYKVCLMFVVVHYEFEYQKIFARESTAIIMKWSLSLYRSLGVFVWKMTLIY